MSVAALDLHCPRCAGELTRRDDAYTCTECHRSYPIVGGIPRLVDQLPAGVGQIQRAFDFEHRQYEDSQYTRLGPRLVDEFLADCQLPKEFFEGIRALDAGCGSGRWTYALAELGANVTAIDLTAGGIESAYDELSDRPNIDFLQANIFELPFAPESFDFVTSWGVLHHTPDTRAAFGRLAPLVRSGGMLYVMVYERYERMRMLGTTALRLVLRRLSPERRYRLCRRLIIRNPKAFALASRIATVAYSGSGLDDSTMQFGLYDAYSPRYNHVHTAPEVSQWFHESGFDQVEVVAAGLGSVRVRGRRR